MVCDTPPNNCSMVPGEVTEACGSQAAMRVLTFSVSAMSESLRNT